VTLHAHSAGPARLIVHKGRRIVTIYNAIDAERVRTLMTSRGEIRARLGRDDRPESPPDTTCLRWSPECVRRTGRRRRWRMNDGGDYLRDYDGDLLYAFGDHDGVRFTGSDFADAAADNTKFLECHFDHVGLERCDLARSSLVDCELSDVRIVATSWSESRWRDTTVTTSRLSGLDMSAAELRRVTFADCKVETANLRGAKLHEVVFERCTLDNLDFTDATLDGCAFKGCTITDLDLVKAKLGETDFRTSTLDILRGHLALAGATIDLGQLLAIAPGLAEQIGIDVRE
jgi:uncharacterized protein YjbI with pentapeptide repeats